MAGRSVTAKKSKTKINPVIWFLENGIRVFPIKPRDKVPACPSWDDYAATPDDAKMWTNYGVALGLLGVVDSDSPEVEAWVAAQVAAKHLPPTPFTVTTARGIHRYYRLGGAAPHFIHRAGHTIEFRNFGQYVVGPGSTHSTGALYVPADWSWNIKDVPFFPRDTFQWEDRPEGQRGSADGQALILPEVIRAGERHDLLFKLMRSLQARGMEDIDELLATLRAANREKCQPPIDDAELTKYVRRVARYKDKPNFTRMEMVEAEALAGSLIEMGAGPETAIAAAKAVDPTFDPSGAAPTKTEAQKLAEQVQRLEGKIAYAKAHVNDPPIPITTPLLDDDDGLETVEFDESNLEVIDAEEIE